MPHSSKSTRLPEWLKKRGVGGEGLRGVKAGLRGSSLHTVCEEARCPNIGECFSRGTATFLIMGDTCTRRCGFCAIARGAPAPLDPDEPRRVAMQVREMGIAHAVVTSVTRDDLPDGGAAHFASAVREMRKAAPGMTIELLVPDFEGREADVRTVCRAYPDVFNHNIETVERLTPLVRGRADYRRSLEVLAAARHLLPSGKVKSGLMVGLGETAAEVKEALGDLKGAGCDIVTIGQYLRPSMAALPVAEYVEPKTFCIYEGIGLAMGLEAVFAGPFVRSSYMAGELLKGRNDDLSGSSATDPGNAKATVDGKAHPWKVLCEHPSTGRGKGLECPT